MKLVFGGSFQGKHMFVAKQLVREGKLTEKEEMDGITAAGEICSLEDLWEKPVIDHFEQVIWRAMEAGRDPYAITKQLLCCNPDVWIMLDEVGSGIVPLDAGRRRWREITGRISCLLSREAEDVYRVLCGIPRCLKKEGAYVSDRSDSSWTYTGQ